MYGQLECTRHSTTIPPTLNNHKMATKGDMDKALAKADTYDEPNYAEIARKHGVEQSTLSWRHRGKTTSREQFQSKRHQCLMDAQERVLIDQINRLTDYRLPPTSQMVRNFAEEIIGHAIGKNWTSNFCRWHKSKLKSLYLRNIDNLYVKSEYGPSYKLFYDLVECFFAFLYYTNKN